MSPEDLQRRIDKIRLQLTTIRDQLNALGYVFREPDAILPGPDSDDERILQRIETEVGPVPRALVEFHRRVGSVDFCGYHPDWSGVSYPDPIVVLPLGAAECELEDFLIDREEYIDGRYRIPIAPDPLHKEDVSGGMWYGIVVPDEREDPPLLEERHNTTFLDYLDIAIGWGGFPGLEVSPASHTWPIDKLVRIANAT